MLTRSGGKMKVLYFLGVSACFVVVAANTVTEYCEEQCKNKCTPCLELVKTCKTNQTDCGLGKPDPVFKGACDPHHVCVDPEFHCPCEDEKGEPYPLRVIVNCEEDEIQCPGPSPGNGCPGQDFCQKRGIDKNGGFCEGFCPPKPCAEDTLHCNMPADPITGCAQPAICVPKARDNNGNICPVQQCPLICLETEFKCEGIEINLGCMEKDTCVLRGTDNSGELCPGKCPVECDPVNEIKCKGQLEPTGCTNPDVCHAKARNINGEFCADSSDSHGCPIICPEGEILCPAKMDILGCKDEAKCVQVDKDDEGNACPESSVCTTICQPNEVNCPGGIDEKGCKKPDTCVPQARDFDGELCPVHCPAMCEDKTIFCEGPRDEQGCQLPDTCHTIGDKTKGNDIGALCPGYCPATCEPHEVKCPSQEDCYGCLSEEVCRPKAKDKNGIFCSDESASHGCPVECDEAKGEVSCPTYETALGCKPKASCIARPKGSDGEFCPSHSVCEKQCQWDEAQCPDGNDSRGCKNADLCLERGKDKDGNLCSSMCPPKCSDSDFFCPGTLLGDGCHGAAQCAPRKYDTNGVECPQICPLSCRLDEKVLPGEKDARGCPSEDKCIPACVGGDGCCSGTNKCDVGEGDCDYDSDCLDGLKCGSNNCPSYRTFGSTEWDSGDDCCYKPAPPRLAWHGIFAQNYSNNHQDQTTINCKGEMIWRGEKLNETGLIKVNDAGVPRPDPNYQGWFYRPWDRSLAWEYFRFTDNGQLEVHHFCMDGCTDTSPLGSINFCCSSVSEGGEKCHEAA